MIQVAQAKLWCWCGFFCRAVLPSIWPLSPSSTTISGSLKAIVAGSPLLPSRAWTNCRVAAAALAAMAASLIRPSAVLSWLSSSCKPCVFIRRNNCSIVQRSRYQSTICQAAATSATAWLVSRRQCTGSAPGGGLRSIASTIRSDTVFREVARIRAVGPQRLDRAKAQAQHRLTRLALGRGEQFDGARRNEVELRRSARQRAAARHRAIVHRAGQHMDVLAGQSRPAGIDVAFPVVHHGDGRCLRQHRLGLLAGVDPAARFLVLEPALGVRARDPALAGVDVAADQAQAAALVGIHRHHRMHQQAAARAFADLAQAAPPAALGLEVDLARVLDGEHVPACHRRGRLLAPAFDQALRRHILVGQEAAEGNLLRPVALGELPQANGLAHDNAIEQLRPFLSRRRSSKRPSDGPSSDMATPRIDSTCRGQNHTPAARCERNLAGDSIRRTHFRHPNRSFRNRNEMCASRSAPPRAGPDRLEPSSLALRGWGSPHRNTSLICAFPAVVGSDLNSRRRRPFRFFRKASKNYPKVSKSFRRGFKNFPKTSISFQDFPESRLIIAL